MTLTIADAESVGTTRSRRRLFTIGGAALALAVGLVTAGIVTPAYAAGTITNINNDYTVQQTGQFTFQATGFTANKTLSVRLGSAGAPVLRTYTIDGSGQVGIGSFARVPIADTVTPGNYTLYFSDNNTVPVTGTVDIEVLEASEAELWLEFEEDDLDPWTGDPVAGGRVYVHGSGWLTNHVSGAALVSLKFETDGGVTIFEHIGSSGGWPDPSNATVWAEVYADSSGDINGEEITLPDGLNSNPQITDGDYQIRGLTGTAQPGDATNVKVTDPFYVIG